MSAVPSIHFLKKGGKCPGCHLYTSCKWEENVRGAIGPLIEKREENVRGTICTLFENGRKMSGVLSVHFLKTGGKCPGG